MQLTTLADKAMLVKLTTRRANLSTRDMMAEEYLQSELGDTAFVVNKKLFRDPSNPINRLLAKASEIRISCPSQLAYCQRLLITESLLGNRRANIPTFPYRRQPLDGTSNGCRCYGSRR